MDDIATRLYLLAAPGTDVLLRIRLSTLSLADWAGRLLFFATNLIDVGSRTRLLSVQHAAQALRLVLETERERLEDMGMRMRSLAVAAPAIATRLPLAVIGDTFVRADAEGLGTNGRGDAWAQPLASHRLLLRTNRARVFGRASGPGPLLLGTLTRTDLDARVFVAATNTLNGVGLVARAAPDGLTFYSVQLAPRGHALWLSKTVQNVTTTLATAVFPWRAGVIYALRLHMRGPVLRAKAWPQGTPEPDAWLLVLHDSDIASAGNCGIIASLGREGESVAFAHFWVADAV